VDKVADTEVKQVHQGIGVMEWFEKDRLRVLNPHQVKQIDNAVEAIARGGQVRLIKSKGSLRFVQVIHGEERI